MSTLVELLKERNSLLLAEREVAEASKTPEEKAAEEEAHAAAMTEAMALREQRLQEREAAEAAKTPEQKAAEKDAQEASQAQAEAVMMEKLKEDITKLRGN